MTPSQLDALGRRLRQAVTEPDLLLLDEYRNSFAPASTQVLQLLRQDFQLEPTARPAKSTRAILAKLHRESTRLSTMQDIAGCRVVVATRMVQDVFVDALRACFADHKLVDRLAKPSHGYRALHVVVKLHGRWVEVQVRTELQHQWAQLCELLADRLGSEIKYGGGNARVRQMLDGLSLTVNAIEKREEDANCEGSAPMTTIQLSPGLPALTFDRQSLKKFLEALGPSLDETLGSK